MNIRKFTANKSLLLSIILLILTSCSTVNYTELSVTQEKIVSAALQSCSKEYSETLDFNGKKFRNDCSGLIYGIFWSSGIDLQSEILNERGNGVRRLHSVMKKRGLIHKRRYPSPGDLIFWSNTYGTWGSKPLSHIGIVVSVDSRGNIEYVHNNTYLGAITKERMNLFTPKEKMPINNYMRYDKVYKKTAAELFDSFGMAWKL